jgi:hypothetical protein
LRANLARGGLEDRGARGPLLERHASAPGRRGR